MAALVAAGSLQAGVTINGAGPVYGTIQAAVNAAGDGDALHVSTGYYHETVAVYNRDITIGGNYDPSDYTTFLPYTHTIVDGSGGGVATVRITNGVVRLKYLELTGGTTPGGGLKVRYGTATAEYCIIYGNHAGAGSSGGGVFVAPGSLTLEHCMVSNNTAESGGGCAASSGGRLTLWNTEVFLNRAWSKGGGVYLLPGSVGVLEMPTTDIRHNYAPEGGGVSVDGADLFMDHNAGIFHNTAATRGGGILAEDSADVHIEDASIGYADWGLNYVTNGRGGGIYAADSSVVMTNSAYLRGNHASLDGGGAYLFNSTLLLDYGSGVGYYTDGHTNSAGRYGGGIYADQSEVYLEHARIEQCYAGNSGGGIYAVDSTVACRDSTVGRDYAGSDRGNYAHFDGGAIYAVNSPVLILDSELALNAAGDDGGAVYLYTGASLAATNVVFESNHAGTGAGHRGGALCAQGNANAGVLDACTVISNTAGGEGGAIYWAAPSELVIGNGSELTANSAGDDGGAVYALLGDVMCVDSQLRYNRADSDSNTVGDGGALCFAGSTHATLAAVNGAALVRNNRAYRGGAIRVTGSADLVVTGGNSCVIHANTAERSGGGLDVSGPGAKARLFGVQIGGPKPLFAGNEALASGGGGGGIAVRDGAKVEASDTTLYGNTTAGRGGGAYVLDAAAVFLSDTTIPDGTRPKGHIINNAAVDVGLGGGVYAQNAEVALLRMCVLSNSAAQRGGGIHSDANSLCWLLNTVVAGNAAPAAGAGVRIYSSSNFIYQCTIAHNYPSGIEVGGELKAISMLNSIVWGHAGTEVSTNLSIAYCDIQGGYPGTGNIDADPLFFDPSTYDYSLSEGSPCIDTGIYASLDTDCIGVSRPQLVTYDMGAYEFVPEPVAAVAALVLAMAALRRASIPCRVRMNMLTDQHHG